MFKNNHASTIHLKDYQAPEFQLLSCHLSFELNAEQTRLTTIYEIKKICNDAELKLDGEALSLEALELDDTILSSDKYQVDEHSLIIPKVPPHFRLKIKTHIKPAQNTALNGLYQSGDMLCTQCEAQGFRRITYSFDRPDVLTIYTVKIMADIVRYPVLLSNGNLIESGTSGDQHFAVWHDPFPKPTYLFALVAGKLSYHSDSFVTRSGKTVDLHVLTRPEDSGKTAHAMASLQRSMAWDEQAYDREYDLEVYHIVAVSDFNMGAMENKSLNVFNTKYVLAKQEIATDQDFHAIEGVIGHEYFHNWSGNRVTCRDWFQLSLKEGFTVLRDQQFSADMGSKGVQRINDVNLLRTVQFKEDAGPMAHPIRPDSYEEINNFYTVTVYEKGAEVVNMVHTLLGEVAFKRACNQYFDTFDGQAVTTDDFIDTMQDSSGVDLSQFRRWYSQAGTPTVSLKTRYDAQAKTLSLKLSQTTPDTPKQSDKAPFLIPLRTALFDQSGRRITFNYENESQNEAVLHLTQHHQLILLTAVENAPVVSILRGFSAPVKLEYEQDEQTLVLLAQHDDDAFNRWEAMQRLSLRQINQQMLDKDTADLSDNFMALYGNLLQDQQTDPALLAQMLILPSESIISQSMDIIDPDIVHQTREAIIRQIASRHHCLLMDRYHSTHQISTGDWTTQEAGHRALRDVCLSLLMRLESPSVYALADTQYKNAHCMTDIMAALNCLTLSNFPQKQQTLDNFHQRWQKEDLLINKWFNLQSHEVGSNALKNIIKLTQHTDFDHKNPNKAYALIGGFLHGNNIMFHAQDGSGYQFAADWVLKLDQTNPQVASRMVSCFNQWKRYSPARQELMEQQMQRIAKQKELSDNVSEIIHKALA